MYKISLKVIKIDISFLKSKVLPAAHFPQWIGTSAYPSSEFSHPGKSPTPPP
jgi:hypothetical protein